MKPEDLPDCANYDQSSPEQKKRVDLSWALRGIPWICLGFSRGWAILGLSCVFLGRQRTKKLHYHKT